MDNKERFKILADISRALNSRYIVLEGDSIFALDDFMGSNFRFTNLNPFADMYTNMSIIDTEELKLFEKEMKSIKYNIDLHLNENKIFTRDGSSININHRSTMNDAILNMLNISNTINSIRNPNFIAHTDEAFHINPQYEEIKKLKADDGIGKIVIDNKYVMTLFSNLIRANKSDNVRLSIYDNMIDSTFLSEFIVVKKKFSVSNNIRYLKI